MAKRTIKGKTATIVHKSGKKKYISMGITRVPLSMEQAVMSCCNTVSRNRQETDAQCAQFEVCGETGWDFTSS